MLLFWGPGLIQFYNDAFVPSMGRDKHPRAMGQCARECWADAWPLVGAQIEAVVSGGEPALHEHALVPILRNGRMEEVFWTYSYSPAFDDRANACGTLVIVTEVTGRVRSARRLESLSWLSTTLSAATSAEAVLEALASTATEAAADIPFFFVSDPSGATIHEVRIEAHRARAITEHVRSAARHDEVCEVELGFSVPISSWPEPTDRVVVSSVGAVSNALVFGLSPRLPFDEGYRSYLAQLVAQVNSALRRIENADASRSMERQRDNLLMHAPVATALLVGPEHRYQLANPLYCKIVGRDPTGKTYLEAFPELHGAPSPDVLGRVYQTGAPFTAREMCLWLDRSGRGPEACYFHFNLEPLFEPHGGVYGVMAVIVEVTDQVRARLALEAANEERERLLLELQKADRVKDEFLAMLGHELRNPLAPILTAVELMRAKNEGTERERSIIERQVRHVVRLVDDLLDVSKITQGLLHLERRDLDLGDVVNQAIEASATLMKQRGHRLSIDAPRGVHVNGDEARLAQVVTNLLLNAARYTPKGGDIHVTLASDDRDAIIQVADSGLGIAAEMLPKIFDMFVQVARSSDRAEGGLGLGLSIVKNLVALHGGSVSASSDGAGKGSVFTLRLPLIDSPARKRGQPAPPAEHGVSAPSRILVVDDHEDSALLLAELARTRGHEVIVAHHPTAALTLACEVRPDVAVLDIGLPVMDGYQLATRLREVCPDCRLIALSGYGQDLHQEQSRSAGFLAHLVKPVSAKVFLEVLTTVKRQVW